MIKAWASYNIPPLPLPERCDLTANLCPGGVQSVLMTPSVSH